MGSTRLPGKVMKQVRGKPLLYYLIKQVQSCKELSKIIIATTILKEDDQIVHYVRSFGGNIYRGSAEDVLSRYYFCAKEHDVDIIVRITSDNPLIDPQIIGRCIREFERGDLDYLSNTIKKEHNVWIRSINKFPNGFAVEVFSFDALEKAYQNAKKPSEREHVTPYMINNPKQFKLGNIENSEDFSIIRVTVDYQIDFDVVKNIIEHFPEDKIFSMSKIVSYLKQNSKLMLMNSKLTPWEGYLKSLKDDEVFEKHDSQM